MSLRLEDEIFDETETAVEEDKDQDSERSWGWRVDEEEEEEDDKEDDGGIHVRDLVNTMMEETLEHNLFQNFL